MITFFAAAQFEGVNLETESDDVENEESNSIKDEPDDLGEFAPEDMLVEDGEIPCCSKSLSSQNQNSSEKQKDKEHSPRYRVYSRQNKRLFEDERVVLEKLGSKQLLVNGSTVVVRDYENYTTEMDVYVPMDENWRTTSMPPLPDCHGCESNCNAPYCRLGCVCDSLKQEPFIRRHCGKPKCFFECTCLQSMLMNGEDGDIRSRLRPRVSLLNWRFAESAERERDTMVSRET